VIAAGARPAEIGFRVSSTGNDVVGLSRWGVVAERADRITLENIRPGSLVVGSVASSVPRCPFLASEGRAGVLRASATGHEREAPELRAVGEGHFITPREESASFP